jgi:hypothetical protein
MGSTLESNKLPGSIGLERTSRLVLVVLAAACMEPDRPISEASTGRDSNQVRIVDNTAPAWQPGGEWRLEPNPVFQIEPVANRPEHGPLDPVAVFRTYGGEIVVADGGMAGWDRLLVYSPDGSFNRFISRKGQGPCEFRQLWGADPYRGDSVAVFDMGNSSMVIVGLDGGCGREIRLPRGMPSRVQARTGLFVNGSHGPYTDGSFLVYSMGYLDVPAGEGPAWFRHTLLRLAPDGTRADTLGAFHSSQQYWSGVRGEHFPYSSSAHYGLDGTGLIYGEGAPFEFSRFDSTGVLVQVVRRSHTQLPVTEEDRIAFVSFRRSSAAVRVEHAPPQPSPTLAERLRRYHWPAKKPAYSGLLVDSGGNVWIEVYRFFDPAEVPDDPPPTKWSVFARDGRWLGDVAVPGRLLLRRVYEDAVYGIWRNEDGTGSIRGYRLVKSDA